MSTSKPRITITLEPHPYEVLRRLSAVNGNSMSSIITQLLDVGIGPLERMVVVAEQLQAMPQEARQEVSDSIHRAEAKLMPIMIDALDQADFFIRDAEARVVPPLQKPSREGSRLRGEGVGDLRVSAKKTPRPVTRGSGHPKAQKTGSRRGRV